MTPPMQTIEIGGLTVGEGLPHLIIAGPCVIEDAGLVMETAKELKRITGDLKLPFIFKSSYDKANRSSGQSFRGPGLKKGLEVLNRVREELGAPILSDVHTPEEAAEAGHVLDVLQIPAFLCRQTDLIVAAARTGRVVNVKKGQFLAPWDMANVVQKIEAAGSRRILLTERAASAIRSSSMRPTASSCRAGRARALPGSGSSWRRSRGPPWPSGAKDSSW